MDLTKNYRTWSYMIDGSDLSIVAIRVFSIGTQLFMSLAYPDDTLILSMNPIMVTVTKEQIKQNDLPALINAIGSVLSPSCNIGSVTYYNGTYEIVSKPAFSFERLDDFMDTPRYRVWLSTVNMSLNFVLYHDELVSLRNVLQQALEIFTVTMESISDD